MERRASSPRRRPAGATAPARSRRRKSTPVGQVTRAMLAPALRRKGFAQSEVIARWPEIVGADIALGAVPLGLKFPPGKRLGGTLMVRVVAAFAPVLKHREPQITAAINSYFGFGAVARLALTQGPLPTQSRRPPRVQRPLSAAEQADIEALVTVEDADLAASLKMLAAAVLARRGAGAKEKS